MLPVLVAILVSAFSSDSPPDHPWDLPALHAQKSATDPCAPVNPCLYNATCTVNNERYRLTPYLCACPVGYSGTTCEIQSLIAVAFSSNMVLQASSPHTTLYGAANATTPGDLITITIHFNTKAASKSKSYHATATMNGSWSVVLGTLAPSTDPATVIIFSEHTHVSQTLTNVLVGDVFVCSGQSNMALPVGSASLPLNSSQTEDLARNYPHIRLLNNGHFWPPTPSHPGGTALGQQTGDAPGWHEPSFGNGSTASPGTVANFSAVCWFMGTTLSDFYSASASGTRAIGLISTDAGGTSIHRWVSQRAAAKCSQITPTTTQSEGADIGTLFNPMVLPLAEMAVRGFTWYQGEANECPTAEPVQMGSPCGGRYYACMIAALIDDWRMTFVNSPPDAPFLVNELGALQDANWPVLRQAFHQATTGLVNAAVVANADMGTTGGRRTSTGLPQGAMHSQRKVNLGRRNGLAMLSLLKENVLRFANETGASGPVLESAKITATTKGGSSSSNAFEVEIVFTKVTAQNLHFAGAAECIGCCRFDNGSAIQLRVVNASDPTGFTWQRSAKPVVQSDGVSIKASFKASAGEVVSVDLLRFMYEGEPECVLYNGKGGPDNATAIAASPFFVDLSSGASPPVLVPASPCPRMLTNGSCAFFPEPCKSYRGNTTGAKNSCTGGVLKKCCWNPITNKGQCEPKGSKGCNRK